MKHLNEFRWKNTILGGVSAALVLAPLLAASCGDEDIPASSPSAGGSAGTSTNTTTGTSGSSGVGGASGTGGSSGAAGSVATGGGGGTGGTGGAAGTASVSDAGTDAKTSDSASDTGTADGGGPAPSTLPIPSGSHARLFNVVWTPGDNIYATGQVTLNTDPEDFAIPLVKILPNGTLDPAFGTGGVVTTNVAVGGKAAELARGLGVQSTGKIVVSGVAEHAGPTDATRDIFVIRYNANGTRDNGFGTGGVLRVVLRGGEFVQQWGLNVLPNDDILLVGARRAAGRGTNEIVVVKLKGTDGAVDTTFGNSGLGVAGEGGYGDGGVEGGADDAGTTDEAGVGGGVFALAIATSINPRTATVLANGSIVACGYTNPGGGINKPVIFKLTPVGLPDPSFAVNGVYFPESGIDGFGAGGITEAYGILPQGDKFVTVGYGKELGTQPGTGFVSLRLTSTGTLDTTYGTGGHVFIGINDQNANSRAMAVLGDNRVVLTGGGSPPKANADAGAQSQNAAVAMLTASGGLDTTFAPGGLRLYNLGGPATGRAAHFFWGVSLSPDKKMLAIVGIKGGITANAEAGVIGGRDEGALLMLPTGN